MSKLGYVAFRSKLQQIKRAFSAESLNFVPKHSPVHEDDVNALRDFITSSKKILVLTGAGISTESGIWSTFSVFLPQIQLGIPDYRSEEVGLYARTNYRPILHQEFVNDDAKRVRYWARNFVGWDSFSRRQPNSTHISIKNLELQLEKVSAVVTQNVDRLHSKAGSRSVVELHGTAYEVVCLNCSKHYDRHQVQEKLKVANPNLRAVATMIRPDGDVEIPQDVIESFHAPYCDNCNGILKPDIVFFGGNVPRKTVHKVEQLVTQSDALLILGSSLSVFSSYRIVLQALDENKDTAIVNIGPTRADKYMKLKISARCGEVLPRIC